MTRLETVPCKNKKSERRLGEFGRRKTLIGDIECRSCRLGHNRVYGE